MGNDLEHSDHPDIHIMGSVPRVCYQLGYPDRFIQLVTLHLQLTNHLCSSVFITHLLHKLNQNYFHMLSNETITIHMNLISNYLPTTRATTRTGIVNYFMFN